MRLPTVSKPIFKIYLSNFLTGFVLWYGIEKLFMQHIGIDAVGIGVAMAAYIVFCLLFDVPAGLLADKWSRKGVLIVSAVALGVCSFVLGSSQGLMLYLVGSLIYGLHEVTSTGTYEALLYDTLHEEARAGEYSKIAGRAQAMLLVGASIANVGSGFIASRVSFEATYYLTVIPCVLNVLVLLTIREPAFHKKEVQAHILQQIKTATAALAKVKLLRVLTLVMTALAVSSMFNDEFGQLYMGRYFSSPEAIGILWAIFAASLAAGSLIAHRFRTRLMPLVICSVVPYIAMSFIDNSFSLVLFMVQAAASAAVMNQIETRIQENTPSNVRASILSVVSTLTRTVSVPAALVLGWLFRDYDELAALRFIAAVCALALVYWLWAGRGLPKANEPLKTETL